MLATRAARNLATHPVDQYLMVEDARLRFRDEGAGPAVILLHGWTLDLEMWDPQVARLRQEFRLVRVDRRGHGFSSGTPSPARDAIENRTKTTVTVFRISPVDAGTRSVLGAAGDSLRAAEASITRSSVAAWLRIAA